MTQAQFELRLATPRTIANDRQGPPLLSNDFHLMSTKLYTFSPNVSFFHQKKL